MMEYLLVLLALQMCSSMTLELTQQMDYLHFTVEVEIGQPPNSHTVKAIVDTGSGSLMVWNYQKEISSTFICGCYENSQKDLCVDSAPEDTCGEFDFCGWKQPDGPCSKSQGIITFACDSEKILWNLQRSGTERMKFEQDPRGIYYNADVIYVDFSDYMKSDYPIHKSDEIREFTDGILGLSYNYSSIGQATSFWDMYGKGIPSSFALELNRGCGINDQLRCEMHIDWVDEEHYKVEYGDSDIEREAMYGEEVVFHELQVYDLAMCNTRLFTDGSSMSSVVDTGSSCLALQKDVFKLLTQLLAEQITCLSTSPGRPKTCFIKKEYLIHLPPLRFRLKPKSHTWHVISLQNLLFADVSDIARGTVSDLELCLQESESGMVFGTMALLNFYTVFDLEKQRVGLASKVEATYIDPYHGYPEECRYGKKGEPALQTPCEKDSKFCDTSSKTSHSSSSDPAMIFATIMIVIAVVAVVVLVWYLYRNHMWQHTRRTMGYRGMGDTSLVNCRVEDEVADAEISTDPGSKYSYNPPR